MPTEFRGTNIDGVLSTGSPCRLGLRIDGGAHRQSLDLVVAVRGHDVQVLPTSRTANLPVGGDTGDLTFVVVPLADDNLSVIVSVYLVRSLALVDEFHMTLGAGARAGARL